MTGDSGRPFRVPELVGGLAFAWLVFLVLYLAGRPLGTDDFWWHLKLGEVYFGAGPWLDRDPLLHTAQMKPDPASWLFDITLYLLHAGVGFQGLRLFHVLLVAAIVWQVFGLFRRESGSTLAAAAATAVVLCLSWYRLVQLRPHLVSILATVVVFRLLISGDRVPGWQRVAAVLLVLLVWVNSHALYLIGLLACAGAFVGVALRSGVARLALRRGVEPPEGFATPGPTLWRLGAATLLGLLVTLLNPRGAARHLTFLRSSDEQAIWRIVDEWTPFAPLSWSDRNPALSVLSWSLVDGLFLVTVGVCAAAAIAVVRRPRRELFEVLDPVLIGFSAAAFVAIATAVRFEWMAVFPLLLLLRALRTGLAARPDLRPLARGLAAGLCVALALALPPLGGYAERTARVPRAPARYVEKPIDGFKYYTQGVRFLRDSGLRGNLFNSYFMGGYLGYWLAPDLLTFVGGTLNYPEEVAAAHRAIAALESGEPDFDALSLLDRYDVDVFFGVGLPIGGLQRGPRYTTAHLEGAPGWTLVFRTLRSAVYVRTNARNRDNLARVADFYRRERVPFDGTAGFDVERVIRERPDWAVARGLLPPRYPRLLAQRADERRDVRLRALHELGDAYAAAGAYAAAAANDRALLAERPDDARALRRLLYALLRQDRLEDATAASGALMRVAGDDPRARAFSALTEAYVEERRRTPHLHPAAGGPTAARALLNRLPLFTPEEAIRAIGG